MLPRSYQLWKTYALIVKGFALSKPKEAVSLLLLFAFFSVYILKKVNGIDLPIKNPLTQSIFLGLLASALLFPRMQQINADGDLLRPLLPRRIYKALVGQKIFAYSLLGLGVLSLYWPKDAEASILGVALVAGLALGLRAILFQRRARSSGRAAGFSVQPWIEALPLSIPTRAYILLQMQGEWRGYTMIGSFLYMLTFSGIVSFILACNAEDIALGFWFLLIPALPAYLSNVFPGLDSDFLEQLNGRWRRHVFFAESLRWSFAWGLFFTASVLALAIVQRHWSHLILLVWALGLFLGSAMQMIAALIRVQSPSNLALRVFTGVLFLMFPPILLFFDYRKVFSRAPSH